MTTPWHDLNRAPLRPSRVLSAWKGGPVAQRAATAQRDSLAQQSRSYEGASVGRLTQDWTALNTSADSELLTSLRVLRARSRQLVRDNPYAKQVVREIVSNVIGNGIGLQAMVKNARGKLIQPVNDSIEQAWADWTDRKVCHTGGQLGWADIERIAVIQLVTAGEVILRKIRAPFGGGRVPLAIEVIEADRLLDNWQAARAPNGNVIRMGVEMDQWHRPTGYWFAPAHPGDYQFTTFQPSRFMRVDAEDIIHLYLVDRWPQSRGEPWMHAAIRDVHHEHGYAEAEVVKARAAANIVGFIRSPEPVAADAVVNSRRLLDTEPGTWQTLLPGEDVAGFTPNTPNPAVEPFLRYMVRKMAVAVGVSYESLSRDYSQSNYSSSRMALLADRDLYRMLQGWFIRTVRCDIHREWLDAAALVGAVKLGADYFTAPAKYQAVRYKPRGWSWIDPSKEVAAYKQAVRCGFMGVGDVIAQTANGADIEDVWHARRDELDLAAELDLVFDSDPAQVNDKGAAQATAAPEEVDSASEGPEGAEDKAPDDDPKPAKSRPAAD